MNEMFEFELTFEVPEKSWDVESLSNAVYAADVGDALVGVGQQGQLGIELRLSGEHAETVILAAVDSILDQLPRGSRLHEVSPDLVSLADVATKLNVKRQALQKRKMPLPVSGGLYRVDEVYTHLLQAMEPDAGKRTPRFNLNAARGWFSAGKAARKLNAKMVLEQLD